MDKVGPKRQGERERTEKILKILAEDIVNLVKHINQHLIKAKQAQFKDKLKDIHA